MTLANSIVRPLLRAAPVALACYWIAMFIGTHYPKPPPVLHDWPGSDKLLHFGAYFGLAVLLAVAWARRTVLTTRHYGMMTLLLAAYGAADELTQMLPFVQREADVVDWAADIAGVAAGLAVFLIVVETARCCVPGWFRVDQTETVAR